MAEREWLGMRLGGMRTWLRGRDWGRPAVNEAGRDGIGLVGEAGNEAGRERLRMGMTVW